MPNHMIINLTTTAPAASWGSADVSFDANAAYIYLQDDYPLLAIQKAARKLRCQGINQVKLDGDLWDLNKQWAFAQGFVDTKGEFDIKWHGEQIIQNTLKQRLDCANFARDLINDTPENVSPMALATRSANWLKAIAEDKINYRIISDKALLDDKWIGTYSVGRGSERPPVMLELDFNPLASDADVDVALVGKGITFDSGGYSLKPSEGMLSMKADMGGAATVVAALGLAIKQGLNKRVKLYLCCAENLVSGDAYKLGDILTYKNGMTVEVVNTDAEGRLVLADGLIAASESGAKVIIDAATLTGAAKMAVGNMYNAIFSPDSNLLHLVHEKAESVAERVWALPLEPWHKEMCPSPYADTANSRVMKGGGAGGASNAAGFLWHFVSGNAKWLHMDLASAFESSSTPLRSAGATAHGVLTIAELLKN